MATLADSTSGTDRAGLVCAYGFTPGAPAHPIDDDDARRWISSRDGSGPAFLWLHFGLSNAAAERWLRQHLMLPNAFYESLRENPSTRVEAVDDALVAVPRHRWR
jgi:zinc transporter